MTFQEEPPTSEHSEKIVSAVDRLTSDEDLIADGSRVYSLPTISGKHKDLKTISPDTVSFIYKTSPNTMVQSDYILHITSKRISKTSGSVSNCASRLVYDMN